MLWFLALATNEDLSEGAGLSAGSTPAGPSFSADSSTVEFVSGAVIALTTALLLRYLKYFNSSRVASSLPLMCSSNVRILSVARSRTPE